MVNEFVYILPDHVGGVASVVGNLLKYSGSAHKKKVILLRTSNDGIITSNFDCDEQIVVNIKKGQSLSSVYTSIGEHISKNSIIISNDGWFEIEALKYLGLDNPIVYILHGNFPYYFNQIHKHRLRISKVIAVSSFLKGMATGYFQGDVEFIRFPIDNGGQFDKTKYNETPIIINYAGRLEDAKGSQFFPDIIERLNQLKIPYIFNVYGTGDHEKFLIRNFKNDKNVHMFGHTSKQIVLDSNNKAHILFLLSKTEGLPVCVVEGMKAGVVPIVFDIPSGINDIIEHNKNGIIVPQGDIEGVVNAIKKLSQNRNLLKEMALTAQRTSSEMFDPYRQTNAYETEYLSSKRIHSSLPIWKRCLLHLPSSEYYKVESYINKTRSLLHLNSI